LISIALRACILSVINIMRSSAVLVVLFTAVVSAYPASNARSLFEREGVCEIGEVGTYCYEELKSGCVVEGTSKDYRVQVRYLGSLRLEFQIVTF
jgi:hypothetical protein